MTDQEYTEARNTLIPEAETFANREVGKSKPREEKKRPDYDYRWTTTFLRKMDSLARERGLVT
jgi:hypothetical protein